MWDSESQKERFLEDGIWENGYDEKYQEVYNRIRIGDQIALKSTYVKDSKSALKIHNVGIVKNVSKSSMRVDVDWSNHFEYKEIIDITWYANTLCEITNEEHIYKIFGTTKTILDNTELLSQNHNLILTGAPGTGKTYLAKQIAKQMIFGETKEKMTKAEEEQFNEQCGFVQFHPSYDYTDFVEGLRPIQDEDGNVGFKRKDGVFKEFCKKSLKYSTNQKGSDVIEEQFDKSWQKLLDFVRGNIAKGVLTKIGIWEYGLSSTDSLKYSSLNTPSKYTFTINKKNVFDAYRGLQARPSGYFQKYIEDVVNFLIENFDLQPYNKSEDITKGQDNLPYVFIIDEINRGEISKIFGELFFSIDPGYRGVDGKVRTQYANMQKDDPNDFDEVLGITAPDNYGHFFVPENVYIIGTMNDIDRSVESMDFAFRRRFAFKEITAINTQTMLDDEKSWGKDSTGNYTLRPDPTIIKEIKKRMDSLNATIWDDETKTGIEGLSSAYHIGASYFLKLANYCNNGTYDDSSFKYLWDYHLEGLLREYLRGMQDVETNINKLKKAYGYPSNSNNE